MDRIIIVSGILFIPAVIMYFFSRDIKPEQQNQLSGPLLSSQDWGKLALHLLSLFLLMLIPCIWSYVSKGLLSLLIMVAVAIYGMLYFFEMMDKSP
jgi:hypothetical protein